MTVWFATGNKHKKRELAAILACDILSNAILSAAAPSNTAWELKIPSEVGLDFGPEETGNTFFDNALIKARELHRLLSEKGVLRCGDPVIADDSGICVDALDGRPGIHSAYYGAPDCRR